MLLESDKWNEDITQREKGFFVKRMLNDPQEIMSLRKDAGFIIFILYTKLCLKP